MRVTSSMYYDNLYGTNNLKLNNELFDVNKQIASGLKIQYAQDDVEVFTKTMQLDNEMTTIGQVKKSTESGYKVSNQSDVVLNEFTTTMDRMRVLLLQASNGSQDEISQNAVAEELRGLEKNLKSLANTSINGQYLFSGSAVNIKPIADDGTYNGNDKSMNAFLGSNTQQQYNLTGSKLFLGDEILIKREISSNKVNKNLLKAYPDLQASEADAKTLSSSSTIRNLMGDTDDVVDTVNDKHFFYLRGTKSDGTAFSQKIAMKDDDKVSELLKQIGNAYGNTPDLDIVNVSINSSGEIVVADKQKNSSKLDFHMVGAVDFNGNSADVTKIDDLDSGETNFDKIILGTSTAANTSLFVKEFNVSNLTPVTGSVSNIDGLIYDRVGFQKDGSQLSANTAQVTNKTNQFATSSTLLSEVADLSQTNAGTLDGTQFKLVGKDITGNDYDVDIDLKSTANGGSTFTMGGTTYKLYNMDTTRTNTDADKVTYQQLMDVINLAVTNTLPADNTAEAYDDAIVKSKQSGATYLSYDGKIQFGDMTSKDTLATVSIYDSNSGNFTAGNAASVMTFNTNSSITIRDPKTDFFKSIDEMITAVEDHKLYPDSSGGAVGGIGIENAIQKMDDLQNHVSRMHAKVGAQSNTLNKSLERTQLLEVSTMTLRSSVIDTDLAESSLKLQQLNLNYQAMLSTVGKISKLSLVNYL
ncbi:flagellin N-terminal helical domain-containing protein [Sulfurimonas sp.]